MRIKWTTPRLSCFFHNNHFFTTTHLLDIRSSQILHGPLNLFNMILNIKLFYTRSLHISRILKIRLNKFTNFVPIIDLVNSYKFTVVLIHILEIIFISWNYMDTIREIVPHLATWWAWLHLIGKANSTALTTKLICDNFVNMLDLFTHRSCCLCF